MHEASLASAMALFHRAALLVARLFEQALSGQAIDVTAADALVADIHDSIARDPGALVSIVRLKRRDDYLCPHAVAVSALMVALGRQLRLPVSELRSAGLAGLLHDLGMLQVPRDTVNKQGALSLEEFAAVRAHPQQGRDLLAQGGMTDTAVLDMCLHHHEKLDGSGYPHGLAGDNISLLACMGSVCDVYDALTSPRPFRAGRDPGEALRHMALCKRHFDPHVFQAFIKTMGVYSVGSLVRLASGRIAVVVRHNPDALLMPEVKAFFSTRSRLRLPPQHIDLSAPNCSDKAIGWESPAAWSFGDMEQLWGVPRGAITKTATVA